MGTEGCRWVRAPRQNPTPQSLLSSRPQLGHPQLRQFTTSTGAPVPSDLHWPQHTLQGHKPLLQDLPPSREPGGQASLLSALGSVCLTPSLPDSALGLPFPHSQPEGSALKCCSDPSQLLAAPESGPQAPAPASPSPASRTAWASPPRQLGLQALLLRAALARPLLQALSPNATHGHGAAPAGWATPKPRCLHAKGPGPPSLPIVIILSAQLVWVPVSPASRAPRGMGRRGASIMGAGEGLERVKGAGPVARPLQLKESPAQPAHSALSASWQAGKGGQLPPGQGWWAGRVGCGAHWSFTTWPSPLSARSSWLLASL